MILNVLTVLILTYEGTEATSSLQRLLSSCLKLDQRDEMDSLETIPENFGARRVHFPILVAEHVPFVL